jgi:hypothetical protein
MIIRWPWLLFALALLAPPPVLSSELRRVVSSARRSAALRAASLARPWQNWLDLIRAILGTWVLVELAIAPAPGKGGVGQSKILLVQFGILAVALVFQIMRLDLKTSRSEQKLQLLAPIFYLCGITLVLSGLTGVFAVFVGWVFAISSKNPAYQLPAMGTALLAGGYVFGLGLMLAGNLALILVPFFEAFVLRKRLVFVGRETRFPNSALKPT